MYACPYATPRMFLRYSVLEELVAGGELLAHHAGDRDHGEAAVVELLGLHLLELHRVVRLEPERVKAEVAARVVGADAPQLAAEGRVEREDGEDLGDGDDEEDGRPDALQRRLLVRDHARHVDAAAEERMELLAPRKPTEASIATRL